MDGLLVGLGALVVATGFGLWRRHVDGRLRPVGGAAPMPEPAGQVGLPAAVTVAVPEAEEASQPLVVDGAPITATDHAVIPATDRLAAGDVGAPLGERATLVQFSSAFCAPCRATRVVLADVARIVPGVSHVEIDAESHLDLVRRLDVTRTPTILLLDTGGVIRTRATGTPRRDDVLNALAAIV